MTRDALPRYDAVAGLPPAVAEAVRGARGDQSALACLPEVGRLLMVLAAQSGGRVAELGTGWGVGAAWLASGLPPGGSLLTVEIDPARAERAKARFAGNQAVQVLAGDWRLALDHGPFDLVFSDGGPKRNPGDPDLLRPLLRPGGLLVLDDYTPALAATDDVSRRIWLESPDWLAIEVQLAADASVILASPAA